MILKRRGPSQKKFRSRKTLARNSTTLPFLSKIKSQFLPEIQRRYRCYVFVATGYLKLIWKSNLEFCKVRWHRDRKTLPFENQQKKLTMINLLNRMENCCARLIKIVRNGRLQRIAEKKRKGQDKSVMAFKFWVCYLRFYPGFDLGFYFWGDILNFHLLFFKPSNSQAGKIHLILCFNVEKDL